MKNSTGRLISKLIAAIPGAAFFGNIQNPKSPQVEQKSVLQLGREENLNRIFQVRYRIQHL